MKRWGTDCSGNPVVTHDDRLLAPGANVTEIAEDNKLHQAKLIGELDFWRDFFKRMNTSGRFLQARQGGWENLVRHLPQIEEQKGRGLDVGCGVVSIYEYAPIGQMSVVAIDPLLPWYDSIYRHPQPRVEYVYDYLDDGRFPFPDNSFDFVSCINVIDHTEFHREIIAEIRRVLKPVSHLYFNVNFDNHLTPPMHTMLWSRSVVQEELEGGFKRIYELTSWNDYHQKDFFWAIFRNEK